MLSEDVANIIIPLHVITGSDHTSGFYGHGKKMLQKVISDPEARELLGGVGESLESKLGLLWKHLSCPKSIMKTQVLLVGRQGLPGGKKWRRRRAQSASLLMTTHWITIRKGQTTSHIARSITICGSIRPLLAMVGNSRMGNADQFATLSSPCLINSYLLTVQMTAAAAMRAVALTTLRFLIQPIQMSSSMLVTLVINGLEELQDLQEQNLQHGNVQDTFFCDYHLTQHEDTLHLSLLWTTSYKAKNWRTVTFKLAALWDLTVKNKSNCKTDIKYEFLDPKNPRNHILHCSFSQTIKKHFSRWPTAAILDFCQLRLMPTLLRATPPPVSFIDLQRRQKH